MLKHIPRITNISKSDKGFTILEVIMAVSILTIGLLAVASLQVTAMRSNSMSMSYTESTERVQDIVEKLLNKDFNDAELSDVTNDGTAGLDRTDGLADHSVSGSVYNVYWNVADDKVWTGGAWRDVNGVKTIRVIVKWQDRGSPKNYHFDVLRNRI